MGRSAYINGIAAASTLALLCIGGPVAAQGILLSQTDSVELRIDGTVQTVASGTDVTVGQEIQVIDQAIGIGFPDGAAMMAMPGATVRIDEYVADAPGSLKLTVDDGVTLFRSGTFPSSSYVLVTEEGAPLVLTGTLVWTDTFGDAQIKIEVDEGSVSFANVDVDADDGTILVTYRVENGQVIIESVETIDTFVTAEMRELAEFFLLQLEPGGGGVPVAGLNQPLANVLRTMENAQQASPTTRP